MWKKVLMIYPEIPETFWSYNHAIALTRYKAVMPPLGLMTIANMLPESYELKLVDMNVHKLTMENIDEADIVFISAMIIQKESFEKVIKMCVKLGKPVVAGGPYPTSSYNKISGVDYFVLNEAEVTLPRFIEDLEKGSPKKIYMDTFKPDISLTPPPRFDLINLKDYFIMPLQFSRGCPFNCEFCGITELFGRTPRTKEVDQFINEMDLLYETGFLGYVFIVDDNFIGNKIKIKALLKKIIEWQEQHAYPFMFFTEASINVASDDELLDLMQHAGFFQLFIGIETPDYETLGKVNKNQNASVDLLESVLKIQKRGIEVMGGFIVGFDTDPENIFDLQIDFINRAGIPEAMVGMLEVLPNTQLYKRLQKEGRLRGESSGNNLDLKLNFATIMSEKKLINGYRKIIKEIYKPQNYFRNVLALYKNMPKYNIFSDAFHNTRRWKQLKTAVRAYRRHAVKMSFSFFKLFLSKNGIHYFLFLTKILFKYCTRTDFLLLLYLLLKGHHLISLGEIIGKIDISTVPDNEISVVENIPEKCLLIGNG